MSTNKDFYALLCYNFAAVRPALQKDRNTAPDQSEDATGKKQLYVRD